MKIMLRCLLAALLLIPVSGWAQSAFTIRGKAIDTTNMQDLHKASVVLMRAQDSVLQTFTRTKSDGSFELHPDSAGTYILTVSFPDYAGFTDKVTAPPSGTLELGDIYMLTRTKLLNEFVFRRNRGSIKVNGDTVEYVADSFQVRDNATVEDLLRRLPGISVDKDGKITAQGTQVQKLLVDGEEFFSDDPAVVSKSLQSRAVESVQVYDKKSDQAIFTGIDDGERTKTINLKLKENRKKGYFGKAAAGGGTDGYYENQLMLNGFKGKRQISAFGIMSNTAKIGLGWEDRGKYGSGNNFSANEDGEFITTYSSNDDFGSWDGNYNGQGLPQVWTGGLHYANRWNEDKEHLSGNYRYMKKNVDVVGNTITQYILPDSQYFSETNRNSYDRGERHGADGLFDWKLDSTSSIRLTVNGSRTATNIFSGYNTRTYGASGTEINRSNRTTDATNTINRENAELIFRKRFGKPGRTISLSLDQSWSATDGNLQLQSGNTYYLNGTAVTDSVNQRKTNVNNQLSVNGSAVYTEPLGKKLFIELRYGLSLQDNDAELLSYNRAPGGEGFNVLDSTFSSSYDYNYTTNSGGTTLRYTGKKLKASIGGSVARTGWKQHDLLRDTTFTRDFNNFFPRASVNYDISQMKRVSITYNGKTRQPSIFQIQPLRQNTDPLNITIGNPSLTQEFNHNFNLNFNSYSVLTDQYVYGGGGFNYLQNAISNSQFVDEAGRRTFQYVNVDGNYNGYFYGGFGRKIKKLKLRTGVGTNINVGRTNNLINGVLNTSRNNSFGGNFNISYEKEKVIDVSFNPHFTWNQNISDVSAVNSSYWTADIDFNITLQLPAKLEVHTDLDWNLREKTSVFTNRNSVFLWNAYVSRKFLKNNQLELRANVYDILNQNLGFSRYGNGNTITQENYNTIRRYGLLSLIWNFTHTGNTAAPETTGGEIIIQE